MNQKKIFDVLDRVAREAVPDDVNLLPGIDARFEHGREKNMQPRWKLATIILLGILAALALTTVAYAIYRFMDDPGLQSVQEAGLVTHVDVTAQPTIFPTPTLSVTPQGASSLGASQTLQGVTVTLDWVYVDEGRLALGLKFSDLPGDATLEAPVVTFVGVTPVQAQGYSQSLRGDGHQAVYVSYQVIQVGPSNDKIELGIDVPLVRNSADGQTPLANFHFDLKDVPVLSGQSLPIQQTYAVRRNGVEVRLKSVRVMPSSTEVVACYDFPTQDAPFWYMQAATVQIGSGPEVSYRPYQYLSEIKDDHCVKLGFAAGNAGGETRLMFRVSQLVVPLTDQDVLPAERIAAANRALAAEGIEIKPAPAGQTEGPGGWQFVRKPEAGSDPLKNPDVLVLQALEEKMDGPWEFYVDIPSEQIIPGQANPTPTALPAVVGEQTIAGVSLTLDWVFADAKRIAFGYTITGLPAVPEATALNGTIEMLDDQGKALGGSGGGSTTIRRVDGKPGTLSGTWSLVLDEPLTQAEGKFRVEFTLGGGSAADMNMVIAQFAIPPEATPYPPGVFPPALPDRKVGTYQFDFTTPIYPMQTLLPDQAVTVNGIEMRLVKMVLTPSYASLILCYQKPSAKDWMVDGMPQNPSLKFGDFSAGIYSYALIYDKDIGGFVSKHIKPADLPKITSGRCVQIEFLLGNSNRSGTLTLTIPHLVQSVPEVIPAAEVKAAQAKLKALGIELDYTTYSSGGGGGGGAVFTKKPAGMTDEEAEQHFMEALGYVYPGPWVFTVPVNR